MYDMFEDKVEEDTGLTKVTEEGPKSIGRYVKRMLSLKKRIARTEAVLSERKAKLEKIENEILPDLMMEYDTDGWRIPSTGEKIILSDVVRASIPTKKGILKTKGDQKLDLIVKRNRDLEWLKANGLGSIIKNEINIDVGKDAEHKDDILSALESAGVNIDVDASVDESVHPGTLVSTIKELLKNGEDVPADHFNLYIGKTVKISKK